MSLFTQLGKLNGLFKAHQTRATGRHLSPVRRIERVAPPKDRRVVAITFGDGPATTANDAGSAVTDAILEILESHGAYGTFDITGVAGGGAGDPVAAGQEDLIRRLIAGGHELVNHSYGQGAIRHGQSAGALRAHLLPSRLILEDMRRLHTYLRDNFGYEMRLGRPPRDGDRTLDGKDAYALYAEMGYNYLAAGFEVGGRASDDTPSGDHATEVAARAGAIEETLKADEGALNGQIIFVARGTGGPGTTSGGAGGGAGNGSGSGSGSGSSQAKRNPVVDALPLQLEALRRAGYEMVTVSELMAISPFADLAPDDACQEAVRGLLAAGHVISFKDNTFRPDRDLTLGEMAVMMLPRSAWRESAEARAAAATVRANAAAAARGRGRVSGSGQGQGYGGQGGLAGPDGVNAGAADRIDDVWEAATAQRGMFGVGSAGGPNLSGDARLRDVRPGHPYYEAIQAVISAGLRVPAGLYKPDMFASRQYALEAVAVVTGNEVPRLRDRHGITRREFATLVWQAVGGKAGGK